MVRGYHVIFGAYGFWLPNDPRGSWSDYVRSWELFRYGPATKVDTRNSVAGARHDVQQREEAKKALRFPPVQFTGLQARAVGRGFQKGIERDGLAVWACAILPDHVHLVIARHERTIEQIRSRLKAAATGRLKEENLHPFQAHADARGQVPKCWVRSGWSVYLNTDADIRRAITYVEGNPLKEGKPAQRWPFVTPYSSEEATV